MESVQFFQMVLEQLDIHVKKKRKFLATNLLPSKVTQIVTQNGSET